jgi:hypothetical protein
MDKHLIALYNEYNSGGLGNIAAALLAVGSCRTPAEQTITLSTGSHEIAIQTAKQPDKVYLSVEEASPVCVGSLNMVAAVIQEGGFVLYADIRSNSALVSYIVQC